MKAEKQQISDIYSVAGTRKPYSIDSARNRGGRPACRISIFEATEEGMKSIGAVAHPPDRLMARMNQEASETAHCCGLLGNLTHLSLMIRRKLALEQRLRISPATRPPLFYDL